MFDMRELKFRMWRYCHAEKRRKYYYLSHQQSFCQAREQLSRVPLNELKIITENFKGIRDWEYKDSRIGDYACHPKMSFDTAV